LPVSGLLISHGALYGTAEFDGPFGAGTAYELKPTGLGQGTWTFNTIHAFGAPGDGQIPAASFIEVGGNFLIDDRQRRKGPMFRRLRHRFRVNASGARANRLGGKHPSRIYGVRR
jgi:hypothetical protein